VKRPAKIDNLMDLIREKLNKAQDRYVDHALQRIKEREVTFPEVRQVLRDGYHEKRKDEFKEEHQAWNYSIRGKTVDKRNLRIAVSFDEDDMLVITVIDLDK
jgi:hypothetical protein